MRLILEHHALKHAERFHTILIVPCKLRHILVERAAAVRPGIGGQKNPRFPVAEEVRAVDAVFRIRIRMHFGSFSKASQVHLPSLPAYSGPVSRLLKQRLIVERDDRRR